MKKIKLSIIVPVYNVEKYLEKCLDSLIMKKMNLYEIILVNDGSTDSSGDICDNYSKKYHNIKTIHKSNGGLSDARNTGIKASCGEYLMFVDSDDFINTKIDLIKVINLLDGDVLQYKMAYYYDKTGKIKQLKDLHVYDDLSIINQLKNKVENDELSVSACNKIVRKKIIIDNNIFFEKGLLSEDIDWSLRLYLHVKTMRTINMDVYVYRQDREGSITNSCSKKSVESLYIIISKWINYPYPNDEIKNIYYSYLAYQFLILISILTKNNCTKDREKEIYQLKYILEKSINKKVKLTNKIISIIGIKNTSKILKLYIKLKSKGIVKI